MVESLGARLLIWHTAIVTVVIAVFGGTICYLVWRARLTDVDAALAARATVLSEALRPADRETFDLTLAPSLVSDERLYHSLWTKNGALIDRSDDEFLIPRSDDEFLIPRSDDDSLIPRSDDKSLAPRSGDELLIPVPTATGVRTREGHRELVARTPSGAVILVGRDLGDLRAELWSLAALLLATGTAVLALSIAAGWLLTGRALAPINRINRTARQMIDGDLSARIPIEHVETELGQVARAINEAFDQLQASLDRQRRLSADVSHELRTPLATLSTEVQWALGRERIAAEYRDSLEVCRRAAGRMQAIVERLLSLARAETTTVRDVSVAIALDDLVRHALADLAPLAAGRHVHVAANLTPATVTGDPDRLLEAITHVVANAISYNVPDGSVTIGLAVGDQSVALSVTDTGVGIAASDLPHVFDPFFRADQARSRDAGGAGLGLAVTRAIVERHGGRIDCTSQPGRGTVVTIELPGARNV